MKVICIPDVKETKSNKSIVFDTPTEAATEFETSSEKVLELIQTGNEYCGYFFDEY